MKESSIVLLSGGLDSLVNFKKALDETNVRLVLTIDYGQVAVEKEIESARLMAEKYQIPHRTLSLDWFKEMNFGLKEEEAIPNYNPAELDDWDYAKKSAGAVWVPNRNGLFLNIAAAYADSMNVHLIIVGFNKEEGATFPDNTSEYLIKANECFRYSTQNKVRAHSYTVFLTKSEIVAYGREIEAPFEFLWSCYHGGDHLCGNCESCRRLKRALKENDFEREFEAIHRWGFSKK